MESLAVHAFLQRAVADVASGALAPLEIYLAAFPGHEAAITREYEALTSRPEFGGAAPQDPVRALARRAAAGADAAAIDVDRIGPYRVLGELGRGGQGRVLRAEDTRLGRMVALKVLPLGAGSAELARLRREGEIAARIDDPHVCTVFEIGEVGGATFVAMQLVEGRTLSSRIAEAAGRTVRLTGGASDDAPADDVLMFVERIARSLHVMHTSGIIHRDLKPANLMVLPDGSPMILDLGLARGEDAELAPLTRTGDWLGTPAYMAPEQLGETFVADAQTDVWALGVVLWECLTGRRLFDVATRESLIAAIRDGEPPRLRRALPSASADLEAVLATALERNRARRYGSALALADDLGRLVRREAVVARRIGPMLRGLRFARRRPAAVAIGALSLALAVGIPTAIAIEARAGERRVSVQRDRADERTRDALRAIRAMLVEVASDDLSGIEELVDVRRELLRRAQGMLATIAESETDAAALGPDLLQIEATLGNLARQTQDFELARELLESALARHEGQPHDELASDGFELHSTLLEVTSALGDAEGAQRHAEAAELLIGRAASELHVLSHAIRHLEAVHRFPQLDEVHATEMLEAAVAAVPADAPVSWRRERLRGVFALAYGRATGDADTAAIATLRDVVDASHDEDFAPSDPAVLMLRSEALWAIGRYVLEHGDAAEAYDHLDEAQQVLTELVDRFPSYRQFRPARIKSWGLLARAAQRRGLEHERDEWIARVRGEIDLATDSGAGSVDALHAAGRALLNAATSLPESASARTEALLELARPIYGNIARRFPDYGQAAMAHVSVWRGLANFAFQRGDWERAKECFRQTGALVEQVLESKDDASAARTRLTALEGLAACGRRTGDAALETSSVHAAVEFATAYLLDDTELENKDRFWFVSKAQRLSFGLAEHRLESGDAVEALATASAWQDSFLRSTEALGTFNEASAWGNHLTLHVAAKIAEHEPLGGPLDGPLAVDTIRLLGRFHADLAGRVRLDTGPRAEIDAKIFALVARLRARLEATGHSPATPPGGDPQLRTLPPHVLGGP